MINNVHHTINDNSDFSYTDEDSGKEGWICGRRVAMKRTIHNTIQCFYPPSIYGEHCQYFDDRVTAIIGLKNSLYIRADLVLRRQHCSTGQEK